MAKDRLLEDKTVSRKPYVEILKAEFERAKKKQRKKLVLGPNCIDATAEAVEAGICIAIVGCLHHPQMTRA